MFNDIFKAIQKPFLLYLVFLLLGIISGYWLNPTTTGDSIEIFNMMTLSNFNSIFIRNASVILIIYISVIFTKKIAYFIYAQNGIILGITITWIIKYDPNLVLLIIPHGIFEIPCLLLTGVILRDGKDMIKINFSKYILYFLIHILFVAIIAIIEVFITPLFLK